VSEWVALALVLISLKVYDVTSHQEREREEKTMVLRGEGSDNGCCSRDILYSAS
jgi:hypothetical protein